MHLYVEKYTRTQIQNRDESVKRVLHASTHRDSGTCIERDAFTEKREVCSITIQREREKGGKRFSRNAVICRGMHLPTETQA